MSSVNNPSKLWAVAQWQRDRLLTGTSAAPSPFVLGQNIEAQTAPTGVGMFLCEK